MCKICVRDQHLQKEGGGIGWRKHHSYQSGGQHHWGKGCSSVCVVGGNKGVRWGPGQAKIIRPLFFHSVQSGNAGCFRKARMLVKSHPSGIGLVAKGWEMYSPQLGNKLFLKGNLCGLSFCVQNVYKLSVLQLPVLFEIEFVHLMANKFEVYSSICSDKCKHPSNKTIPVNVTNTFITPIQFPLSYS